MSGFKHTAGGPKTFLNVSCGSLINNKQGLSYDGWEGTLIGIEKFENEYKGKTNVKVALQFAEVDETEKKTKVCQIGFTDNTWFSHGFFSRISKINLKKPFLLGVMGSDQNEKVSFCYLKQDGKKIEPDKKFPKPDKQKQGKNTIVIWDKVEKKTDSMVSEISKKVKENLKKFKIEEVSKDEEKGTGKKKGKKDSKLPF